MKLIIILTLAFPVLSFGQYNPLGGNYVDVKGYERSNGTYVQGYQRQRPQNNPLENSHNDYTNYDRALQQGQMQKQQWQDLNQGNSFGGYQDLSW